MCIKTNIPLQMVTISSADLGKQSAKVKTGQHHSLDCHDWAPLLKWTYKAICQAMAKRFPWIMPEIHSEKNKRRLIYHNNNSDMPNRIRRHRFIPPMMQKELIRFNAVETDVAPSIHDTVAAAHFLDVDCPGDLGPPRKRDSHIYQNIDPESAREEESAQMHQRGTPPRLIPRMEEVTPTFKWNNTPEIPLPPELLTPPESAVRRPLNLTISSSSVNIASGWREKKGEGASIQPPGQGNVEHAESTERHATPDLFSPNWLTTDWSPGGVVDQEQAYSINDNPLELSDGLSQWLEGSTLQKGSSCPVSTNVYQRNKRCLTLVRKAACVQIMPPFVAVCINQPPITDISPHCGKTQSTSQSTGEADEMDGGTLSDQAPRPAHRQPRSKKDSMISGLATKLSDSPLRVAIGTVRGLTGEDTSGTPHRKHSGKCSLGDEMRAVDVEKTNTDCRCCHLAAENEKELAACAAITPDVFFARFGGGSATVSETFLSAEGCAVEQRNIVTPADVSPNCEEMVGAGRRPNEDIELNQKSKLVQPSSVNPSRAHQLEVALAKSDLKGCRLVAQVCPLRLLLSA
eukprot:GHVN01034631.1.p2 GENE.GHVN01034631.1~~GHVN01034631.1.p2  ORF type:complete len:573 (+),score=73.08 GHVN01034631.1:874-2592(+)